eukprot:COSAG01_NODE_69_length_28801_cov_10.460038_13_plen_465_part_00
MAKLGSESCALRVAVIGAGPSGFYAVDQLFKSDKNVEVDLFDALPTPYGLLRGGVAPDHQRMKSVAKYYERVAVKNKEKFNFLGNVEVGKDIQIDELKEYYDAIILSYGASGDRLTGLPGEDLKNIHSAREFVAWYNGHPDYTDYQFDLSSESVAIIGQGNVAVDVARILGKTIEELKSSDIPEPVLKKLAESKVKDIYMIGRRSPVQVAFTEMEIKELGELDDCNVIVDSKDLDLSSSNKAELEDSSNNKAQKNYRVLDAYSKKQTQNKNKNIHIKFFSSPTNFEGEKKVSGLNCEKVTLEGEPFKQKIQYTGKNISYKADLVFRSIGYKGLSLKGVPYNEKKGVIPNKEGQVIDENEKPCTGLYTSGWIKRGPSGVIGTNKPCSTETVNTLLEQIENLNTAKNRNSEDLIKKLEESGCQVVSFEDWLKIDEIEVKEGQALGKPREKIIRREEALKKINKAKV